MTLGRLSDRVAIVTGGAAGIGASVSRLFLQEGASLVIVGRSQEKAQPLLDEAGRREVLYVQGDVADPDTCTAAVQAALGRFGRLDILVNNAGVDYSDKLLLETPDADARYVVSVNLLGAFFMLREAARGMQRTGGAIANVASRAGIVGIPQMAIYGATKAGLIGLTRAAAVELAPHSIRVNAVAPGPTETRLMRAWIDSQDDPRSFQDSLVQRLFQHRLATPDEVATAILFLVSSESSFITGACLPVDGGYTAE